MRFPHKEEDVGSNPTVTTNEVRCHMKQIVILGGGTFNHVRNHLSIAAPAFGETARKLQTMFNEGLSMRKKHDYNVKLVLTKMADPSSKLVTNEDVEHYVDNLLLDREVKVIIFNVAMADFTGQIGEIQSGKHAERLKTRDSKGEPNKYSMLLTPAPKVIKKIRKERKDIFVVAFKTTCGANAQEQYLAALNLLKENSVNLVLANDTVTRRNFVVVPEEALYQVSMERDVTLRTLVDMTVNRMGLRYTRSTVVEAPSVDWNSELIPASLREVVNHCIKKGAYKPFRGATAGHFAVKIDDKTFITSKRKTNFNELDKVGMVKVVAENDDSVIAYGAKPSVGGQSQRIIFKEHDDVDCIVHFHCPPKTNVVPERSQMPYECGSHECGKNTSDGLKMVEPGIKAVYLDKHGPNIVFNKNMDPKKVIAFIDKHFDLSSKTGLPVQLAA